MTIHPAAVGVILSLVFILPLIDILSRTRHEPFETLTAATFAANAAAKQAPIHDDACALQSRIQAQAKSTAGEGELPPTYFACLPKTAFEIPHTSTPSFQDRELTKSMIMNLYTNATQLSSGLDQAITDTQNTLTELKRQIATFDANTFTPSTEEAFTDECPAQAAQKKSTAENAACAAIAAGIDSSIRSNATMLSAMADALPPKIQKLQTLLKELDDLKN